MVDSPEAVQQQHNQDNKEQVNTQVEVAGSVQSDPSSPAIPGSIPPPEIAKMIPCRFFAAGTCKYADKCAFSHTASPGQVSQATLAAAPAQSTSPAPVQQFDQQQQQVQQGQQQQQQPMYYNGPPPPEEFNAQFAQQQQHYHHQHAQQQQQQYFYPPTPQFNPYGYAPQAYYGQQQQQPAFEGGEQQPGSPSAQGQYQPFPGQAQFDQQQYYAQQQQQQQPQSSNAAAMHTFFQTSSVAPPPQANLSPLAPASTELARAPSSQASATAVSPRASPSQQNIPLPAVPAPVPNGVAVPGVPFKGVPRGPIPANRRSFGGPTGAGGPSIPFFPRAGKPSAGGAGRFNGAPRPSCSFFEANRCAKGDGCNFTHPLPDGTDARSLGRNIIGVDGRTENPEEKGGMPPAWLANPRKMPFRAGGGQGAQGGAFAQRGERAQRLSLGGAQQPFVGGQHAQHQQNLILQQQHHQQMQFAAQQQAQLAAANGGVAPAPVDGVAPVQQGQMQHPLPQAPHFHQQHQQQQRAPGVNGAQQQQGAPTNLVAAIQGLTRGIPPVQQRAQQPANGQQQNASGASTPAGGKKAQEAQQQPQRLPTENDFPALAPTTPNSENRPASPVGQAAAPAVTSPGLADDYVLVSHADAAAPAAAAPAATETATAAPAGEATEVKAEETKVAEATPAAPAAKPAPRVMGSFASAAARGAAAPAPVVEKVVRKKAAPVAAAEGAEKKEDAAVPAQKKDEDGFQAPKKTRKPKAPKGAQAPPAPVAIKA